MSILLWFTRFRGYREACRCHSTPGARKCGVSIVLFAPNSHSSTWHLWEWAVNVCVCVLCKAVLYEKETAHHCGGVCVRVRDGS